MAGPKQPKRRQALAVFLDYSSNTSLHGFNYFPSNRGVVEVVFWAIVIFVGFVIGTALISEAFSVGQLF